MVLQHSLYIINYSGSRKSSMTWQDSHSPNCFDPLALECYSYNKNCHCRKMGWVDIITSNVRQKLLISKQWQLQLSPTILPVFHLHSKLLFIFWPFLNGLGFLYNLLREWKKTGPTRQLIIYYRGGLLLEASIWIHLIHGTNKWKWYLYTSV